MTTDLREEDLATELTEIIQDADISKDEVLAFLAYESDRCDASTIIDARENGAQIGSVDRHARRLRPRVKQEVQAALK